MDLECCGQVSKFGNSRNRLARAEDNTVKGEVRKFPILVLEWWKRFAEIALAASRMVASRIVASRMAVSGTAASGMAVSGTAASGMAASGMAASEMTGFWKAASWKAALGIAGFEIAASVWFLYVMYMDAPVGVPVVFVGVYKLIVVLNMSSVCTWM